MNGDNVSGNSGGRGSMIGSIIVVIILILGAVYLFANKANAPQSSQAPISNTSGTGGQVTTPRSDEIEAIEADADLTSNAGLDDTTELEEIIKQP